MTITSAAGVHNGPSAAADIIGRAYAGARARVASRDAGWAQIVDPASGNTGWVDSRLLVPSPTTETAATEDPLGEAPDGARDRSLEDQSPRHLKARIRHPNRSMPPKQNVIERTTTIMVARGSHSDFSLGASDANVSSPPKMLTCRRMRTFEPDEYLG